MPGFKSGFVLGYMIDKSIKKNECSGLSGVIETVAGVDIETVLGADS